MPDDRAPVPSTSDLQFRRAEPVTPEDAPQPAGQQCAACQQPFSGTYFHAQGQVVCPTCAQRIESGQQAPPRTSLARAALYGTGAALLGCALYATVAIVTKLEIGLIAIVIGMMVGKAIRHASNGRGGRPQQILAVLLTYFSITSSHIPVYLYERSQQPATAGQPGDSEPLSPASAAVIVVVLVIAAPFLALQSGLSGLISLAIIFFGISQAWKLTGRTEILITGPYEPT